jgi:hypothetical protein
LAWFKCFIRGENFPGALAGISGLVGFYTTRFVEAADASEAEAHALDELRGEPRLSPPPGYQPTGIAKVFFEEISELPGSKVRDPQPGFVWYPMDADADPDAAANPGDGPRLL